MKKIILPILIILSSVPLFSLIPQNILAQCPDKGIVPCGTEGCPCTLCHFFLMFKNIIDFVFWTLVPPVAVLMLVIGGFMFFFAGGSPGILARAKSIITATVIGLVIIYAAWIIINTFFVVIGVQEWTGLKEGWFSIDCTIPP